MSEFQLSHIALVGARIEAFSEYGIEDRNDLKSRRIAPNGTTATPGRDVLAAQLPLWVHNIITDPEFPQRKQLLMPLRRFEGELKDKKDDEVVSAVMSAGFRNQTLNPLDLPRSMTTQQRCALVAQIGVWQQAYLKLEDELVSIMSKEGVALAQWCEFASRPGNSTIEQ